MEISWFSLIPPFLVTFVGLATHSLNKALISGIISSAFIASQWNLANSFFLIGLRFWEQILQLDNIFLYSFLFFIGVIVILLYKGSGPHAFVSLAIQQVHHKKTIEYSVLLSSCMLAIDDYLSMLTVGHVMKKVTDSFYIPREKLAFFIHALAGSIVVLVPISSWVAAITGYLVQSGIEASSTDNTLFLVDPFFVYLKTIPYLFYSSL